MDNMNELNLDQMEQVNGGTARMINTGMEKKAAIRRDPWIDKKNCYYDAASGRNFVQIKFTDKYGNEQTGYVAASIVGLPR